METETKFFPRESFHKLAKAEAGHWWFRSRNRILLWVLKKYVCKFDTLLEIGCGTGFVLQAISKAFPNVVLQGSEYFEEGLVYARRRVPSAQFRQLDARKMEEREDYDVIGAFDVIEHINEDELVLSNLCHALKVGGILLITVPQHKWLWSAVDENACHVRRYTRLELIEKVKRSGFTVEYISSFVSLLVPLMWISRMRANKTKNNTIDEFSVPSYINCFLEMIMSIELWLMKMGVKLPFGGSLLLMGRKNQ